MAVYYGMLDLVSTPRQLCVDGCMVISGHHGSELNEHSKMDMIARQG